MIKKAALTGISCWISAALVILISLQACGKKGDPVPPRLIPPPQVSDLKAIEVKKQVALSWTVTDEGTDIGKVRILKNDPVLMGETCPGCPVKYVTIADIFPGDRKMIRQDGNSMEYVDNAVEEGRIYRYRILLCDSFGNCGRESNTAEIKLKERK